MNEARDVLAEVGALYGALPEPPRGVVHVVSAVRRANGRLHVLAIGPRAPKSDTDFFVLQLARARADAVLTTAQILRDEPHLSLTFTGPWADALVRYRRDHLGLRTPLICAMLTRSGDVPVAHALWREPTPKLVLAHAQVAARVASILADRAEVAADASPSARRLLTLLAERGAACVSVEAGPSTIAELYEPPAAIDELWLSIAELTVEDAALGKALPEDDVLFAELTCVSDVRRGETSGVWRFQRWVRRVA